MNFILLLRIKDSVMLLVSTNRSIFINLIGSIFVIQLNEWCHFSGGHGTNTIRAFANWSTASHMAVSGSMHTDKSLAISLTKGSHFAYINIRFTTTKKMDAVLTLSG